MILDFYNAGEKCSKLYCTKAEIIKAAITINPYRVSYSKSLVYFKITLKIN